MWPAIPIKIRSAITIPKVYNNAYQGFGSLFAAFELILQCG
jgi:hypothetical protein